eukprot:Gb_22119 [translate_table: standard]
MLEVNNNNGRDKGIEHQVVESKENERISIAIFYSLVLEMDVGPTLDFIDDAHPC